MSSFSIVQDGVTQAVGINNFITADSNGSFGYLSGQALTDKIAELNQSETRKGTWSFNAPSNEIVWTSTTFSAAQAEVGFALSGNFDPFISYAVAVSNTSGTTQTYSFGTGSSLVPTITSPYTLYADVGVTLVNNPAPTSDATLTPTLLTSGGTFLQSVTLRESQFAAGFNGGVDLGSGSYTVPMGSGGAGSTGVFGPFATTIAGGPPATFYGWWDLNTSFSLSAGDRATVAGFAQITPVPEPGQVGLLALGLGATVLVGARRRKARAGAARAEGG